MAESSKAKAKAKAHHPPPFDDPPDDERNDEVEGDESARLLISDDDDTPAAHPSTLIRILTALALTSSIFAIVLLIVTQIVLDTVYGRSYDMPWRLHLGMQAVTASVRQTRKSRLIRIRSYNSLSSPSLSQHTTRLVLVPMRRWLHCWLTLCLMC